jgi:hypothetical protein
MTRTEGSPRVRPESLATLVVTAVVLGPLLVHGGFALRGDMVFVPDQPWKPAWLGLDGSVPRAVPMDALVSWVDEIIPGALLQRLLLVGAFVSGGVGIGRLARPFNAPGRVAAVVVYLWNPWVYERLGIGQWATVLAYGLLPGVVLAASRARDGRPGGWPATALMLVLTAVCAPSMGLLGAVLAVSVVAAGRRPRRVVAVLGLVAVANLPWVVPALLGPSLRADPHQFSHFAAQGESALGTATSLLSMGGIWKSSVVPPERTHVLVVGVAALFALACLAGLRYAVPALGRRTTVALVAAAAASALIALLPGIGSVGHALGSLSSHWAAVGILRDSHRYLAPLGLALALGAAALVDRLWRQVRVAGGGGLGVVALLLVVAPVVLLPSMVWGLAGALRPVDYPGDWSRAAEVVARGDGAVAVLPWTGSYRGYGWNDYRAVLDPAPRFLPGEVLVDDRVFLHDGVLRGEDPFLARVGACWGEPDAAARLSELGVRWVLVEKGNGVAATDIPPGEMAFDGRWLTMIDLGPPVQDLGHWRDAPSAWMVRVGDAATLLLACVAVSHLLRGSFRTRR